MVPPEACYPVPVPAALKTCMVGFRTPAGEWVRVVSGESVFEAASCALAFFASDDWYGPQPCAETGFSGRRRASVPRAVRAGDGVASGTSSARIRLGPSGH